MKKLLFTLVLLISVQTASSYVGPDEPFDSASSWSYDPNPFNYPEPSENSSGVRTVIYDDGTAETSLLVSTMSLVILAFFFL